MEEKKESIRKRIIEYFKANPDKEVTAKELKNILNVSVSQMYGELKCLTFQRFLKRSWRGKWFYKLNEENTKCPHDFVLYEEEGDVFKEKCAICGEVL